MDMHGRICLVTGATRGIGRATAEGLARLGATVIVHGRDAAAVDAVCREIARDTGRTDVSGAVADFASLASVRGLAHDIVARGNPLHVLVNNAGTSAGRRRSTVDGFEWQLGVNHLAPFALTNLLDEPLRDGAPSRVVNVASAAHRRGALDFDDLSWEQRKYRGIQAYSDSKLANLLFTLELARRLVGSGITANALHPGVVATNIFGHMGAAGKLFGWLARPLLLSPEKGARTSVYLASAAEVAGVSGKYFVDCREHAPSTAARDAAAARRLWDVSEQMTRGFSAG
jgi:NAD(P)-dependent dehydrogenase (short-subunit alcohol dehydrogenase family)